MLVFVSLSAFYRASAWLVMQSRALATVELSVRPSVRLSVCHALALCQNDASYDHEIYVGGRIAHGL